MEEPTCAICLSDLSSRQRKLHTTTCGHVFHETCFEQIKRPNDEPFTTLNCPCCRAEIEPSMKVQIRDFDVRIRELSDYVRMCPLVQQVYIAQQNDRIRELQEALDEAKKKKRIVTAELADTNRHNKQVLENHKMARKLLYDNLQQEMEEHRRKKSDMRAEKKQAKDAESVLPAAVAGAVVGPKKVKIRVVPPVSTGDGV